MMDEKNYRKYPRIKKNIALGIRTMDSLTAYAMSCTNDISAGGFSLDVAYLDGVPVVDQVIEITMEAPDREAAITAIGKIAWVRSNEDRDDFEIGVMLTYIKGEDRGSFLACLAGEGQLTNR